MTSLRVMRREFSKIIKRDAFVRCGGNCECCGMRLQTGAAHYDHRIPDALGGEPTLDNVQVLCRPCHNIKTRTRDIPAIAKTKRIQDRERGIRPPRQQIKSRGFTRQAPQRTASKPVYWRSQIDA